MGTFGYPTIGATPANFGSPNAVWLCKFTSSPDCGTITEIVAYINGKWGTANAVAVLYSDNAGYPLHVLGVSAVQPIGQTQSWVRFPLTYVGSPNTVYWLGVFVDADFTTYFDEGEVNQSIVMWSDTFPIPPDPWWYMDYSNAKVSIYATYLPAGLNITVSPSSASLQVNQQQTFTASVTGGTAPYAISWINKATSEVLGQDTTITLAFPDAGNYIIFAGAIDALNTTADSPDIPITVTALPPPPPPPPPTHQLTIASTPIQGIPFTIERVS